MQIAGRFQTLQTLVMMTSHLRALEKTPFILERFYPSCGPKANSENRLKNIKGLIQKRLAPLGDADFEIGIKPFCQLIQPIKCEMLDTILHNVIHARGINVQLLSELELSHFVQHDMSDELLT